MTRQHDVFLPCSCGQHPSPTGGPAGDASRHQDGAATASAPGVGGRLLLSTAPQDSWPVPEPGLPSPFALWSHIPSPGHLPLR